MSTPTVLPAAALARLAPGSALGGAPGAPLGSTAGGGAGPGGTTVGEAAGAGGAAGFVRPALVRAAVCLLPVPLAMAASEPLGRMPWPVPVGALVLGWGTAAALSPLAGRVSALLDPVAGGVSAMRGSGDGRAGDAGAARPVLVGFAAVAAAWSGLLAVAPEQLVGTDRLLAYAASLPTLALLAALAAAAASGAELVLLRWSLPALLLAGSMIADWPPVAVPAVPAEALLLAAICLIALRMLVPPALVPRKRAASGRATPSFREIGHASRTAALRLGAAWLALGLSQAVTVVLVWRIGHATGHARGAPPALVPLLLSVPLIEVLVGRHRTRLAAGLATYDDRDRYLRYARRVGWGTLAALLPPLVAGAALAGTATRLPYGLSSHPDAPALVLAMAGGVLLAGLVAAGRVLAAGDRPGLAAVVTGGAVLGGPALAVSVPGLAAASLSGWGPLLPATVIALAVAYAAGLVLAAHVLFDTRSLR